MQSQRPKNGGMDQARLDPFVCRLLHFGSNPVAFQTTPDGATICVTTEMEPRVGVAPTMFPCYCFAGRPVTVPATRRVNGRGSWTYTN